MPKILINEIDNTSAGTPGSYANYSVLITGYRGAPSAAANAKIVEPDFNGVYEFSSAQAFKDTIGEADVEKKVNGQVVEAHYGNRMAIELLSLGYPIIYKVINSVHDMASENFWEDFKDKASYDFRFISHGLLSTCYNEAEHHELYIRFDEIKNDIAKFQEIQKNVAKAIKSNPDTELTTEIEYARVVLAKDQKYTDAEGNIVLVDGQELTGDGYTGFKKAENTLYSYDEVRELFDTTAGDITTARAYQSQQNLINDHENNNITSTTFNSINEQIAKLASYRTDDAGKELNAGRGDCIALIELDENAYTTNTVNKRPEELIIDGIDGMPGSIVDNGAYCAITVPSVHYVVDRAKNITMKMPGAFHYLACFMSSISNGFAEWYAAAGYTRGVCGYTIDHTSVKLGEIAINALEPRNLDNDPQTKQPKFAVNVIANFRGSYYLWGNRTAAKVEAEAGGGDLTAKHFLNIRQLCTTIKKQLYVSCRRFTFDPNSDVLWINFKNSITPMLDRMKADQGVRDYKIEKVYTDKKATLKARIRIVPIEAVEDFLLEVSLEDSLGETAVTIAE